MSESESEDSGESSEFVPNPDASGDEIAAGILGDVASLVNDDRDTHGDAVVNQEHTARGWTWYLRGKGLLAPDEEVTGADVARLMDILKMSRLCVGEYDADHDLDRVGYSGIATACEILQGNVDIDEQEVIELDGITVTIEEND
jgi:hypothetical protein